jgi:N-acetylmuramoyl-L-alanine amidase
MTAKELLQALKMVRVVVSPERLWFESLLLDPGHGGRDSGAVGPTGLKEADVALSICLWTELLVRQSAPSVKLSLTHRGSGMTPEARRQAIRDAGADVMVSVHCNAADSKTAKGGEIYTTVGETVSDPVAANIAKRVQKQFPDLKWRAGPEGKPDREAGFYVLRTQESLARAGVLLETMFISNPAEERLLSQPIVQFRFACAVASGLLCEQPAIS